MLPHREKFASDKHYLAVKLHEHGHWTGPKSRINRDRTGPGFPLGRGKITIKVRPLLWRTSLSGRFGDNLHASSPARPLSEALWKDAAYAAKELVAKRRPRAMR
jgi:hypothetical protein